MLESVLVAVLIIALVWWIIQSLGIPQPINLVILLLVVLMVFGGGYVGHSNYHWF
jgi:hypothetical protein